MTLTPEQQEQAKDMFNYYLKGCVPYVNEEIFPGRIFWMKDGMYYFEYDKEYPNFLLIRYSIWVDFGEKFGEKFNLSYNQTSNLLKPLVEETFKLEQLNPHLSMHLPTFQAEETFKLGKLTPRVGIIMELNEVEDVFKIGQLTPLSQSCNATP